MGLVRDAGCSGLYFVDDILVAMGRKDFKIQTLVATHDGEVVIMDHHPLRVFF